MSESRRRWKLLRTALFVTLRALWLGLNAGAFLVAVWYSTLPPMEGTHPGFLVALVWIFLFPGVVAMVAALALLNVMVPEPSPRTGTLLFFSVWAGGAWLTYYFWFVWLRRKLTSRRDVSSGSDHAADRAAIEKLREQDIAATRLTTRPGAR
jgi:hypothetical protein